jgi:hypothetical protein
VSHHLYMLLHQGIGLKICEDISITSHSAFFANLLVVLGHQPYPLATGEMIPVVVKATRLSGGRGNGH